MNNNHNTVVLNFSDRGAAELDYPDVQSEINKFLTTGQVGNYPVTKPVIWVAMRDVDTNTIRAVGNFDSKRPRGVGTKSSNRLYELYCKNVKELSVPNPLPKFYSFIYCNYNPETETFSS